MTIASSLETSSVVHMSRLFFHLDSVEASDERDANDATDSSSSDLARVRSPPAAVAGVRKTLSDASAVVRELLVILLGGSPETSIRLLLIFSLGAKTHPEAWRSTPKRPWR